MAEQGRRPALDYWPARRGKSSALSHPRARPHSSQEYKRLHLFLSNVTQAFRRYDADRSGSLDEREIKTALRDAGFQLEEPAFKALFRSFDPDRRVAVVTVSGQDGKPNALPCAASSREVTRSTNRLSLILSPAPARRSNSMCLTEFMGMTIFLQSLSSTFRAFDPQSRGQVTLSFNQAVYFVSNCT